MAQGIANFVVAVLRRHPGDRRDRAHRDQRAHRRAHAGRRHRARADAARDRARGRAARALHSAGGARRRAGRGRGQHGRLEGLRRAAALLDPLPRRAARPRSSSRSCSTCRPRWRSASCSPACSSSTACRTSRKSSASRRATRRIAACRLFGALFFGSVAKLEPLLDARGAARFIVLDMHQVDQPRQHRARRPARAPPPDGRAGRQPDPLRTQSAPGSPDSPLTLGCRDR